MAFCSDERGCRVVSSNKTWLSFKNLHESAAKVLKGRRERRRLRRQTQRTMVFEALEPRLLLDGLTGSAVVLPAAPATTTTVTSSATPSSPTVAPASSS